MYVLGLDLPQVIDQKHRPCNISLWHKPCYQIAQIRSPALIGLRFCLLLSALFQILGIRNDIVLTTAWILGIQKSSIIIEHGNKLEQIFGRLGPRQANQSPAGQRPGLFRLLGHKSFTRTKHSDISAPPTMHERDHAEGRPHWPSTCLQCIWLACVTSHRFFPSSTALTRPRLRFGFSWHNISLASTAAQLDALREQVACRSDWSSRIVRFPAGKHGIHGYDW